MTRTAPVVLGVVLSLSLAAPHARGNLIVNGNFEAGYAGFKTDYVTSPTSVVGGAGQYLLVKNPGGHHPSGASYGDHTTGSGRMMMVNGSHDSSAVVWSQTLTVYPHSSYDFSLWLSSWVSASPATLDIRFNGVSVGTPTAPSETGVWQKFSTTWNSGSATSLTIEIRDTNTADVGNDFALDDISLTARDLPEPPARLTASSRAVVEPDGVAPAGASGRRRPDGLVELGCVGLLVTGVGLLGWSWRHQKRGSTGKHH
jgi:hypothetical protein